MGWPQAMAKEAFSIGETILVLPDPICKVPLGPLFSVVPWKKLVSCLTCSDEDNWREN